MTKTPIDYATSSTPAPVTAKTIIGRALAAVAAAVSVILLLLPIHLTPYRWQLQYSAVAGSTAYFGASASNAQVFSHSDPSIIRTPDGSIAFSNRLLAVPLETLLLLSIAVALTTWIAARRWRMGLAAQIILPIVDSLLIIIVLPLFAPA